MVSSPGTGTTIRAVVPRCRATAVVADDSAVIRTGVVRILEGAGIEVVREAKTADELLAVVAETLARSRGGRHPDAARWQRRA